MGKVALAVRKEHVIDPDMSEEGTYVLGGDLPFLQLSLFSSVCELMPRPDIETNNDYIQFIPYVTLTVQPNSDTQAKYFVYTRGDASGENRLVGKCSLGLGGHIEQECDDDNLLPTIVKRAAKREILEEVGLDLDELGYNIEFMNFNSSPLVMLYNNNDEVGRHHVGIYGNVFVTEQDIFGSPFKMEEGVITKGQLVTYDQLSDLILTNQIELETWSKIIFDKIIGPAHKDYLQSLELKRLVAEQTDVLSAQLNAQSLSEQVDDNK